MSKRSIPRLAIATLTLGGACSDGDGDSKGASLKTEGVNATSARTSDIAEEVCAQFQMCAPAVFRDEYTSAAHCERLFREHIEEIDSDACKDALLDSYACFTQLACETDESDAAYEECEELYELAYEICDVEPASSGDDSSTGGDSSSDDYDYDYDY